MTVTTTNKTTGTVHASEIANKPILAKDIKAMSGPSKEKIGYDILQYNDDNTVTKLSIPSGYLSINRDEEDFSSFLHVNWLSPRPQYTITIEGVTSYVYQPNRLKEPRKKPTRLFELTEENIGDRMRYTPTEEDGRITNYEGEIYSVKRYYIQKDDNFVLDHLQLKVGHYGLTVREDAEINEIELKVNWLT